VERFFDGANPQGAVPKALIAPHAGYVYSGQVAASAYTEVLAHSGRIQRIILLGPSHHVSFNGVASVSAPSFLTPLGAMNVDRGAIAEAVSLGIIHVSDQAHAQEHCLEVHLPFMQHLFPRASMVPLLTGDRDSTQARQALIHLWGGDETLIVISSDLSHYHDYTHAQKMDLTTAKKIQQLTDSIGFDEACGATAINGLLSAATNRGLACRLLDLRNSGDTAGTRDQVVGYGAFAFD
jgi:AmmeMemoRadiSam system protein B